MYFKVREAAEQNTNVVNEHGLCKVDLINVIQIFTSIFKITIIVLRYVSARIAFNL